MLPPPTTIAISTPSLWTATTSSAIAASVSASMPVRRPPINASPESFRRMRLYLGRAPSVIGASLLHIRHDFSREVVAALLDSLTQFVARKPRDRVRAAGVFAGGLEVAADALLVVADVRLLEQAGLAVKLLHLAGDHLLDDVLGLAGFRGHIARDLALGVEVLLRDVLAPDEARLGRRDVHGNVARDFCRAIALVVRDQLGHDADFSAGVDVRSDRGVGRGLVAHETADRHLLPDFRDDVRGLLLH